VALSSTHRHRLIVAHRGPALWTPDASRTKLSRIRQLDIRDLPPGVIPNAVFRPIVTTRPSADSPATPDIIWATPTPEFLDRPDLPDNPAALLAGVPFEGAMARLSLLAAEVQFAREDTELHKRLARIFYPPDIADRIAAFVDGSDRHLAFDSQQIAMLQREVVRHASDDPSLRLDAATREALSLALLAVATRGDGGSPEIADDVSEADLESWQRYLAQLGAYYARPWFGEHLARTWSWYLDVAPSLTDHADYCPADDWLRETYGLGIAEQVAVGIALAKVSGALEPPLSSEERLLRAPRLDVFADTALADRAKEAIALISADRDEFRELLVASDQDPVRARFDNSAFETRPFLRARDGRLWLTSPFALNAWMSRGFHYRVLNAATAGLDPADTAELGRRRDRWLRFAGSLGERSVYRLLSGSFFTSRLAHERLHPEITYEGPNGEQRSPDAAIESHPDLALIEVFSGRMNLAAKASDNNEPLMAYLSKAIAKKLAEVLDRADEVLSGLLAYPDWEGTPERIYPVLVLTEDAPPVTPLLWRWVSDELGDRLTGNPQIAQPLIADLDDFEPLLRLVDRGRSFFDLLREFQASPEQQYDVRHWLVDRVGPDIPSLPHYTGEQLDAAHKAAVRVLYPNSEI